MRCGDVAVSAPHTAQQTQRATHRRLDHVNRTQVDAIENMPKDHTVSELCQDAIVSIILDRVDTAKDVGAKAVFQFGQWWEHIVVDGKWTCYPVVGR